MITINRCCLKIEHRYCSYITKLLDYSICNQLIKWVWLGKHIGPEAGPVPPAVCMCVLYAHVCMCVWMCYKYHYYLEMVLLTTTQNSQLTSNHVQRCSQSPNKSPPSHCACAVSITTSLNRFRRVHVCVHVCMCIVHMCVYVCMCALCMCMCMCVCVIWFLIHYYCISAAVLLNLHSQHKVACICTGYIG